MINISAPQLDNLIYRARNGNAAPDEQTKDMILALFQKLQLIAACGDDELREIWFTAERGSIEDFGDYDEYLADEDVESHEEFEALWLGEYPEPQKWYKLAMTNYIDIYLIYINNKLTLQISPEMENKYPFDQTELLTWLLDSVDNTLNALSDGSYNDFIRANLPYKKRIGKILREDYWHIFPETKDEYLKDITPDEINRFADMVKTQTLDSPVERLPEMTAGLFFDCCQLGYEANKYDGINNLTPQQLYRKYADGRDEGLLGINADSAEDFAEWYHTRTRIGHPWEVCRGGNSTHISLYVNYDARGWWFSLAGSSWGRSIETIKFYMALIDNGLPIFLYDGQELAAMITGQDYIGIVSEGILPVYCSSMFPGEKMLSYMNLPWERKDAEAIINKAEWFPLADVKLND